MCALYVTLIGGAYALYFMSAYLIDLYQAKTIQDYATKTAQGLKRTIEDANVRAMADTVGGTTPQETLQMYISALGKGNYELASEYFIEDRQAGVLKSLNTSPKKNIDTVVRLLKQIIIPTGIYFMDKTRFVIRKPLPVDFTLYPNGIWKIEQGGF
jgi:hypothetical protein